MEMRVFGRTGMQLSVLGLGCGTVGELMVRGDPFDQEHIMARAIAVGVNYLTPRCSTATANRQRISNRVPGSIPGVTSMQIKHLAEARESQSIRRVQAL